MSNADGRQTDNNTMLFKWYCEMYKHLCEEKRSIDRHMWQLPAATFATIGLLLNAAILLLRSNASTYFHYFLGLILFLLDSILCCITILILIRFRCRRIARQNRIEDLENGIKEIYKPTLLTNFTSVIKSDDVDDIVLKEIPKSRIFSCLVGVVNKGTSRLTCYELAFFSVLFLLISVILLLSIISLYVSRVIGVMN